MFKPQDKPPNSFRVVLELTSASPRLDTLLLEALRKQSRNLDLKILSRNGLKDLFKAKRIRIKGQPATPSSGIAQGTTYVDIMGYEDTKEA
ncbi:MAG: hypothetical protein HY075_01110 [Deltaproteobacteria bacterium]|nr:hypothetical protein [Deltaproteobacteria bacterium]